MGLTPGLALLARFAVVVVLPAVLFSTALLRILNAHPPMWIRIALPPVLILLYAIVQVNVSEFKKDREAARMGARRVPVVKGKWIGNLDVMTELVRVFEEGYPAESLAPGYAALGQTANLRMVWADMIQTCDPAALKLILATDAANYEKGAEFRGFMESLLGTGVFNADGEMWKFHRSMSRPFFTREKFFHFDIFERHAETVITKIKERCKAGYPIDFQDAVLRFTLDSASEFLFGSCVDSLSDDLPYSPMLPSPPPAPATTEKTLSSEFSRTFPAAFINAQQRTSERGWRSWAWPLFEIFGDRTKASMKIVDEHIEPIVREAIRKHQERGQGDGEKEDDEEETLLDNLVKQSSDPKLLRDETLNILIAGRDTTASTLTFLFHFLAMYPAVLAKLREEILAQVGPTRRPTYDDIRDMKYLRAVINETLRLFPAVPLNVRSTIDAAVWPSSDPSQKPLYIPARTKILYSVFMMHRRTDLWGPDAEEFDPDRFIDERNKRYFGANPFIFLPFNAGPRICLGQQFAYNEMSFMIIRLLQSFSSMKLDSAALPVEARPPKEWSEAPGRKGKDNFFPRSHLTMYLAGGLWLIMQE